VLISSISVFLSISDLGIGNGIINPLVNAKIRKDKEYTSRVLTNVIAIGGLISASILALAFLLIYSPLNLAKYIIHIEISNIQLLLVIAALAASISLAGNIVQKIFLAWENNRAFSRLQLLIILMSNSGLIFGSQGRDPLVWMLLASLVLPNVFGIVVLLFFIKINKSIKIKLNYVSRKVIFNLIREGRLFFFLHVAFIVSFQIDVILISQFFDSVQIAEYSIVMKISSLPIILISAAVQPVWAQTASFISRGEIENAKQNLFKNLRVVLAFGFLSMILFMFLGSELIKIWTSGQISPGREIILANAIWIPVSVVMQLYAMFLNGVGASKYIVYSTSLFTLSNILFSLYFLKYFSNLSGPMWSNSISSLFFFIIPTVIFTLMFRSGRNGVNGEK
jgi:O-antigen/teichoic acid export membrane protein